MRLIKPITWASLLILSAAMAHAQESPATKPVAEPKSPEAVAALRRYGTAQVAAKGEWDKVMATAVGELVKELEAAKEKATKAGDLDGAVMLRDVIKGLKTTKAPPDVDIERPEARAALGHYRDARARADASKAKSQAGAQADLKQALETAKDKAAKAGDLDEALRLRNRIAAIGTESAEPAASTDAPITAVPKPATPADMKDPAKLRQLRLVHFWETLRPKTTLDARVITGEFRLTKAGSPYLINGLLVVDRKGRLVAEGGAVVVFASDAKIENQGTLSFTATDDWIVLANAQGGDVWAGLESSGTVQMRRCVVAGAATAIEAHHTRDVSISECIFADNKIGVSCGNGGSGTVRNSILLGNGIGLFGHGDGGTVSFSTCLLLANERGISANFEGRVDGTNSTFLANTIALECPDRAEGVRVRLSNILASTDSPAFSKGGRIHAESNYWGALASPKIERVETGASLPFGLSSESRRMSSW